jgi:RNA-binding protein
MLTGKDKRQLRALGHHLSAIVMVGTNGITAGVVAATKQALADHELIKVKFADEDRESRREAFVELASQTKSEIAQTVGRTLLLFRQRQKKSKIKLKTEKANSPTAVEEEE